MKKIEIEIRTCICGCGRTFKCKINSTQKFILGHNLKVKIPWNKNLTKEVDPRVAKNAEGTSRTRKKKFESGELKPSFGMLGKVSPRKNKTNIEYYGIKKAQELSNSMSNSHIGKYRNPHENRTCICGCGQIFNCVVTSTKRYFSADCMKGENNPAKRPEVRLKIRIKALEKGKYVSQKTREKMSNSAILRIQNYDGPWKDAKSTEIPVQNILKENGIIFEKQKHIGKHTVDIYIKLGNGLGLCIEPDGYYIHAKPTRYKADDIVHGELAKDIWERDKIITETLESKRNIVLRFWEDDIQQDINKVLETILKAIEENKGEIKMLEYKPQIEQLIEDNKEDNQFSAEKWDFKTFSSVYKTEDFNLSIKEETCLKN